MRCHLRDRAAEGLDGAPVDNPVGRGTAPHGAGPEPAQQRLGAHVHPDQAEVVGAELDQVQVGGPDHLAAVDVDQLVVEDVARQQHLALAPLEGAQVELGRAQLRPAGVEVGHVVPGHPRALPADAHDHARDRGVGLGPAPLGDEVDD